MAALYLLRVAIGHRLSELGRFVIRKGKTMLSHHQYADLFPMMSPDEYAELLADMDASGYDPAFPITIYEGQILDGRNRYRAAQELMLEPQYCEYDGDDPLAFVLRCNLHRRHLNATQRAVIAARLANMQMGDNQYTGGSANLQTQKVSQADAAAMFQVSPRTVATVKAVMDEAPDLLQAMEAGTMTAHGATVEIEKRRNVHFLSETDECYTPPEIISRVIAALGSIDLDPCSNSKEAPNVPAASHLTREDDGLLHEWHGRVFMNPPYGREVVAWIEHLCTEYEAGRTTAAIALVAARTDTEWFRRLRNYPRCFIWGRLRFSNQENSAPFPSMAVYLGPSLPAFLAAFADVGDVYEVVNGA